MFFLLNNSPQHTLFIIEKFANNFPWHINQKFLLKDMFFEYLKYFNYDF